jgi:acyl carrier protein
MEMNIRLNGSNYVSEKTQRAFEEALQDGHRVKPEAENSPAPAREASEPPRTPPQRPRSRAKPVKRADLKPQLPHLERGIDRSYAHQQEILRVHEQYLQGQAEYANVFSQLMEHQRRLLDQEDGTPEHTQALLAVLDHLSRSLSQFHEHQGETLKVHDRFLSRQSEYAQAQVRLLQQQIELAVDGHVTSEAASAPVASLPSALEPTTPNPSEVDRVEASRAIQAAADRPAPTHQAAPAAPSASVETDPTSQDAGSQPDDGEAIDAEVLTSSLLACVSESTGYPAEMLELDMDMEADLGIDSIKRVEILGALQDAHPSLPTFEAEDLAELRSLGEIVDYARSHANGHYDESVSDPREVQNPPTPEHAPSPASASREGAPLPDVETLQRALLDIVSESTGYPAEMLELDMDMEADLGIDSIKRVEILGALQDTYPNLPQVEAEALGELRTLGEIVNFMDNPPQTSAPDDDEDGSKKA